MRSRTVLVGLTVGMLGFPVTAGAAEATGSSSQQRARAAGACWFEVGAVNAAGDHLTSSLQATRPISRREMMRNEGVLKDLPVRLHPTWMMIPEIGVGVTGFRGYVVAGDTLYERTYAVADGEPPNSVRTIRIGSGWRDFTALAHPVGSFDPTYRYALRKDGTLHRWVVAWKSEEAEGWSRRGVFSGFGAVKTMTMFSETKEYDTLLMTTRGGALYTVRIPHRQPTQPVVKRVRAATWQGFETILANRCGRTGSLVLGIDHDTQAGYLYAVGHANGPSTVIQSLGKVPGTFPHPVTFRVFNMAGEQPLFGE